MLARNKNHQSDLPSENPNAGQTKKPVSDSTLKRISRKFRRYWFIALPAVMLNIGITLDHVIATNNENTFKVRIKEVAEEAIEFSKQQDGAPLSDKLRAHWITTNAEGNLDGRISAIEPTQSLTIPIERLDVALLKKGEKVRKATTDYDGRFVLEDVEPGIYTLVAAGQNGFLAYGVNVLPKLEGFDILNSNTKAEQEELIRAYYVSHYNVPQDSVIAENLQIDAAAIPPEFSTLQRISQNYLPAAAALAIGRDTDDAKAVGKESNISSGFKQPLSADGSFEGSIQPIATDDGEPAKLSEMNIFLIQDDIEAARVAVEENGQFKIEDVEPGVYSMVAAGKDGFAALSIELVSAAGNLQGSTAGNSKAYYVSHPATKPIAPLSISIVTDAEDIEVIKQEVDRIVEMRKQMQNPGNQFPNQGQFPQGNDFAQGAGQSGFGQSGFGQGGFGQGGFGGSSGNFPGTTGTGPISSPSGPRGGSGIGGNSGRNLVAIAALALAITAVAKKDSSAPPVTDPPPSSPMRPSFPPVTSDSSNTPALQ